MPVCCGKGERGKLSDNGVGKKGDPVDISTGEGAKKSGERGGTKTAMVVSNESSGRQRSEREESSVKGLRNRDWGNREKPKIR